MRGRSLVTVAVACVATLAGAAAVALADSDNRDGLLKDERHFKAQAQATYEGAVKGGSALNMVAVGHTDLGARGFNADVWAHEGYAYVGQWGFADWATGNNRFCPGETIVGSR